MRGRLFTIMIVVLLLAGLVPLNTAYASDCTWYVVRRGENLSQIARRYGVSVTVIVTSNGISNPSKIYTGQTLCIPKAGSSSSSKNCPVTYVVKRGDTLREIAARYGVPPKAIANANDIENWNKIYPGQKLVIWVPCTRPPKPGPPPGPPPPPPPPPHKNLWKGLYWTNRDQAGNPKFTRFVDPLSIDWGNGGPPGLGVSDNFSMRWTRTQYFSGGRYLFHLRTKDGVRLLVDGELLLNEWHEVQGPTNYAVEKQLHPGNHTVRVDYFAGYGPAQVHLQIEPLGGPIDGGPGGPWNAEYFNNANLQGAPERRTTYSYLDFDWGRGSPLPGVAADFFSGRYVGDFHFTGGDYRFYVTSDDGVRVWVDDQLILDQWHIQARTTYSQDRNLSEGTHKVKVEYFEQTGVAFLKVFWTKN